MCFSRRHLAFSSVTSKLFRDGHQVSQIRATLNKLFGPQTPCAVEIFGVCHSSANSYKICQQQRCLAELSPTLSPTQFSGEVRARVQLTLAKPVTTTLHKRHGGGGVASGGSSRAIGGRDDALLWEGPGYDDPKLRCISSSNLMMKEDDPIDVSPTAST